MVANHLSPTAERKARRIINLLYLKPDNTFAPFLTGEKAIQAVQYRILAMSNTGQLEQGPTESAKPRPTHRE